MYQQKEYNAKKLTVTCFNCKNKFTKDRDADLTKIKCPNCKTILNYTNTSRNHTK